MTVMFWGPKPVDIGDLHIGPLSRLQRYKFLSYREVLHVLSEPSELSELLELRFVS